MIDWIKDFEEKFGSHPIISKLHGDSFHGKLVINFGSGSPHTAHIDMCVKAYAGTSETVTQGNKPTLKGGGENGKQ